MGLRSAPKLAVIRFADEAGQARFARHLVQQIPTVLGTMGQVQLDRRQPGHVLRFIVGSPPGRQPGRRPPQ